MSKMLRIKARSNETHVNGQVKDQHLIGMSTRNLAYALEVRRLLMWKPKKYWSIQTLREQIKWIFQHEGGTILAEETNGGAKQGIGSVEPWLEALIGIYESIKQKEEIASVHASGEH